MLLKNYIKKCYVWLCALTRHHAQNYYKKLLGSQSSISDVQLLFCLDYIHERGLDLIIMQKSDSADSNRQTKYSVKCTRVTSHNNGFDQML